MTEKIANLMQ